MVHTVVSVIMTIVSWILTNSPLRRAPYLMQENFREPECVTILNSKPPCLKYKDAKKMETKLWIYFLKFDEKAHSSMSNLRPAGQPGMCLTCLAHIHLSAPWP